ncbi:MAG: long-chain-fatty-acid--CoA ligase, partial [Candidatus Hodarchaeales archaeon]
LHNDEKLWFKSWPEGVKKTTSYPRITLNDHFERAVKKKPDMVYLTFSGVSYTFREINELSDKFATALSKLDIIKKDRVAIFMPNLPQFVIAFYGAMKTGAIVVPCNPVYGSKDLKFQLNDAGVSIIIVLDLLYATVEEIRDDCPELKHVIVASVGELFSPIKRLLGRLAGKLPKSPPVRNTDPKFLQLIDSTDPEPLTVEFDPVEDIALLQYTGGTTGKPKGAMLTHYNLVANLKQAHEWLINIVVEDESFVGALPFFHLFGLMTIMLAAVQLEATIHLVPDPRKFKMIFEIIHKEKPAYFHGVPTLYLALLNSPLFKNYDLSSLKACISGAAPLPVQLANDFEKATSGETIIVEGYGMTELSPIATINPADKENRKVGSVGLPVPDTDVRIIDPELMKELPPGEIGEIAVSGPQVMKGYWNRPDETEFVLREFNGSVYMFTGDLGYMDDDGFFFVVERIKDMINVSGYKVFPREVEEILFTHPDIKEAAVVGVHDDYRGETVKAFIVTKDGSELTQKDLYEFCRGKIAKYKIPRIVELRYSLPLTAVGKVYRRGLRDESKE